MGRRGARRVGRSCSPFHSHSRFIPFPFPRVSPSPPRSIHHQPEPSPCKECVMSPDASSKSMTPLRVRCGKRKRWCRWCLTVAYSRRASTGTSPNTNTQRVSRAHPPALPPPRDALVAHLRGVGGGVADVLSRGRHRLQERDVRVRVREHEELTAQWEEGEDNVAGWDGKVKAKR
jgi:hypothetical protein